MNFQKGCRISFRFLSAVKMLNSQSPDARMLVLIREVIKMKIPSWRANLQSGRGIFQFRRKSPHRKSPNDKLEAKKS